MWCCKAVEARVNDLTTTRRDVMPLSEYQVYEALIRMSSRVSKFTGQAVRSNVVGQFANSQSDAG